MQCLEAIVLIVNDYQVAISSLRDATRTMGYAYAQMATLNFPGSAIFSSCCHDCQKG
ncbi:hypothetical protein GXM_07005 [Nostoc sphaeroides CCNUC1]|uniref:Uncharacterized protein n=1 Tax=Nostoc sphaeroides CCNUC1 TaxID=2653204 RepID=A0A5P8WAD7_9NOSO|nr:hypothetical protein GXM_07005 [Nostoc sphaeroides CCNUC1]